MSSIKAIAILPCSQMIVSKRTNNASYIEVLEELTVPPPPEFGPEGSESVLAGFNMSFAVVSVWSRVHGPAAASVRVVVKLPSGNEVVLGDEQTADLTEVSRHRFAIWLPAFPVEGEGVYAFTAQLKNAAGEWEESLSYPVNIKYDKDLVD